VRVGLISDTHGLLRPEALAALERSDRIVHAGDIGEPSIIAALEAIAPVTAVRGNNDRDAWAAAIPEVDTLKVGAVSILVVHDLATLADGAAKRHRVVVSGHSHRPAIVERDGVLYVNPGSAGPRRFTLPVSIGELVIDGGDVKARLIDLARFLAAASAGKLAPRNDDKPQETTMGNRDRQRKEPKKPKQPKKPKT
jgi:putative phosphoesterase